MSVLNMKKGVRSLSSAGYSKYSTHVLKLCFLAETHTHTHTYIHTHTHTYLFVLNLNPQRKAEEGVQKISKKQNKNKKNNSINICCSLTLT